MEGPRDNKYRKVEFIFASTNILKIVSDTQKFREWLRSYHETSNDNELFQGYKFFIITSIKLVLNSISLDSHFGIENDFVYRRAEFTGAPIEDLPNSCDKIILLKNIWSLCDDIQISRNWININKAIGNLEQLYTTMNKLYDYSAATDSNYQKDYVLNIQTIFYTYIYLNDTSRGLPLASLFPVIIIPHVKKEHFTNAFTGYVYTLQYLWYNLLGPEEFENRCTANMHKTNQVTPKKWSIIRRYFDDQRTD